ncbi:MAG: hypothetical protein ACLQDY_00640 [Streptosporangiaceae bacterium]
MPVVAALMGVENVFPAQGFTVTDDLCLSPATAPKAGSLVDDDVELNISTGVCGIDTAPCAGAALRISTGPGARPRPAAAQRQGRPLAGLGCGARRRAWQDRQHAALADCGGVARARARGDLRGHARRGGDHLG